MIRSEQLSGTEMDERVRKERELRCQRQRKCNACSLARYGLSRAALGRRAVLPKARAGLVPMSHKRAFAMLACLLCMYISILIGGIE